MRSYITTIKTNKLTKRREQRAWKLTPVYRVRSSFTRVPRTHSVDRIVSTNGVRKTTHTHAKG